MKELKKKKRRVQRTGEWEGEGRRRRKLQATQILSSTLFSLTQSLSLALIYFLERDCGDGCWSGGGGGAGGGIVGRK